MVSCLTLLNDSHVLAQSREGFNFTLCGLVIDEADTEPGLIAPDEEAATCAGCRTTFSIQGAAAMAGTPARDTKSLVMRLIGQLNANDAAALDETVGAPLLVALSPRRIERLHELFPGWHASVDEVIVDADTAVLRYSVTCSDAFGLLGAPGPSNRQGQAVVFRVANGLIAVAGAIVDDFAFWSGLGQPAGSACADCDEPSR